MKSLHEVVLETLSDIIRDKDLDEYELQAVVEKAIENAVPDAVDRLLSSLRASAPEMLRDRRKSTTAFEKRNFKRWKPAFDLIEMIWVVACEVGAEFNEEARPVAVKEHDYLFEALTSIHAKTLLVSSEAIHLMRGGYPDGALSRWRTLHELNVISAFLSEHEQETALRYLASFDFAALKAAREFNRHAAGAAGGDIYSVEELQQLEQRCDAAAKLMGERLPHDYSWAAKALEKVKPSFVDIERAVGMDRWRPQFRWASVHTHAGHRPPGNLLGTAESRQIMLLVGPSNSGLTDPFQFVAGSLTETTVRLLLTKPNLDRIVFAEVLLKLSNDVGAVAWKREKQTLERARRRQKKTTKDDKT